MTEAGRFGVFLPSYVWEGDGYDRAQAFIAFARTVEDLGFDGLFITDHLLEARQFYAVSWLEPLTALALAAGVTERVRLGTSILILPLRQPVLLAKQLATLHYLSRGRLILGAGVGWYGPEFDAVGVDKSDRGRRSDEILDVVVPLLEGETVSHHGPFYDFDDVAIQPTMERRPDVWIGGGSQIAAPGSHDPPRFARAVMARVLRGEGWIVRPSCPPQDIARDWLALRGFLEVNGRDPATVTVAHENFLHLVMTTDPRRAREEQHAAFLRVMSAERAPSYLESVYLFGTPDEIIASLQARADAGVEYFMLHTMTPDSNQLEWWVKEIIPNVRVHAVDKQGASV